jgi:hypothetical protein
MQSITKEKKTSKAQVFSKGDQVTKCIQPGYGCRCTVIDVKHTVKNGQKIKVKSCITGDVWSFQKSSNFMLTPYDRIVQASEVARFTTTTTANSTQPAQITKSTKNTKSTKSTEIMPKAPPPPPVRRQRWAEADKEAAQILNKMPTHSSIKTDAAKNDADGDWIAFLPDATNGAIQYAKCHNLDLAKCIKKLYMDGKCSSLRLVSVEDLQGFTSRSSASSSNCKM